MLQQKKSKRNNKRIEKLEMRSIKRLMMLCKENVKKMHLNLHVRRNWSDKFENLRKSQSFEQQDMIQQKLLDMDYFKRCRLLSYVKELSMKRSDDRLKLKKNEKKYWVKMKNMLIWLKVKLREYMKNDWRQSKQRILKESKNEFKSLND